MAKRIRNLIVVLGDQLDLKSSVFDGFERALDLVWMAEVDNESTHVWSHKARIVLFLSAMRHFRDALRKKGINVDYRELDATGNRGNFADEFSAAVAKYKPQRIKLVEPGEWRIRNLFLTRADELDVELDLLPDDHFLCSPEEFAEHARGKKQLRMEYFYREMRRRHGVLMNGDEPLGGDWNFDSANRKPFGKSGPQSLPHQRGFRPDAITKAMMALVEKRFPDHPGSLSKFDWAVTARQAKQVLSDFIHNRLPCFGDFQDAMWTDEPYLYHSRLSAALNLKLINPRDVIRAAEAAYQDGSAPLNAVEGFIRQILGWREYVRGIYWLNMPDYLQRNALQARQPLPDFYWTAETDMNCLRQTIGQTLEYGYAHHIQRLMVTGLFALLMGVDPRAVHEWYLAVYVDAVEWVELPNTLGMSQFADGGLMASKPYVATGKYIQRMSNYCDGCKFDPALAVGDNACPFTTLYWDFLKRHEEDLSSNARMSLQLANMRRKSADEKKAISVQAKKVRNSIPSSTGRR